MCLILLALGVVPQRPWLMLGNRDEFHARPTAPAQVWKDAPEIIGGRDLEAGGTWLALNRNGRFAAITNVRATEPRRGQRSRGELVAQFLTGSATPERYAADAVSRRDDYGPFNLVVGNTRCVAVASSLLDAEWTLASGIHVISNGPPKHEWPKSRRLREMFSAHLSAGKIGDDALLDLLGDTFQPDDAELPRTGVATDLERFLAPIFIRGAEYGTRASTLAYATENGGLVLHERRFGADGIALGADRLEA